MTRYRVYLPRTDGRPPAMRELDCASEADAFRSAAELIGSHPALELWRGAECVGALTPAECRRLLGNG